MPVLPDSTATPSSPTNLRVICRRSHDIDEIACHDQLGSQGGPSIFELRAAVGFSRHNDAGCIRCRTLFDRKGC